MNLEEFGRCDGEDEMTVDDFDVRSIVERKSIKNLSIENLSKINRKSIENLSKIYRTSIEHLSKI